MNRNGALRAQRKANRQEHILSSAITVIAEKGYHGTRIADIAERAGVAYGLVYHYFGSKERIFSHIVESLWQRFGDRIRRIRQQELSGVEKLTQISDYMLDTLIARPDLIRLLVQEVVRARNFKELPHFELVRRIVEMIEEIFQASIERGELPADADPRFLSFAFFGAVDTTLTMLSSGVYSDGRKVDARYVKGVKRRMRTFLHSGSFGRVV
ncbi:MAG: TetR/AcrR family transcriptional regulator [Leptospirales bacterium]|nr:TetR/AcrR family transcriptional regulator [Leptospirales bacterium]